MKPSDADRRAVAAAAAMAEIRPGSRGSGSSDSSGREPPRLFTFFAGPPTAPRRNGNE